jgi:hypothetical protein
MRLFTKLWSTLLLLCVAGVANAATEYEIDQKFTSVAALDGQLFAIVNETDGKAIYNKDAQNLAYDTYTNAIAGAAYYWKIHSLSTSSDENVQNAYAIEAVKADGSSIGLWGNPAIYLNSGAEGGFDGCFVLGNGEQYGTDVRYGGAWEIEYDADKGFALKNVARGGYFAGVNPAPTSAEPIYWTFCTLKAGAEVPDPDPVVIPEPEAPLGEGELIPDFFSICDEGGIPYGYDVKFGSENRAYPSVYTGGARMFNFAEGGDFTKGIYFREGYIQYGNVKKLALEAGKKYIVHFNSAMWKSSGATMDLKIYKEGDLENAVLTQTINNAPDVNGSKEAVTGSTESNIEFVPETDGNYILMWDASGWREVLLANVGVKVSTDVTPDPIVPAYGTIWEDGEKAEDGDFMSIQMDAAYFKGLAKENDTIRVSFTNVGQAAASRRVIHDGKIQLTDGDNILAELSEIKVGATSVDFALTQDMVAKIEAAANVFVRYQYMTVTKVELLEYAVPAPPAPEIADGTYYIYNVAAQKYLAAGASWGTHAVVNAAGLDYGVALAEGKYTLDSQVSNGGAKHFLNGEYNDGDAFGWTIEKVAEGVFTISNGEKFLAAGEGDLVSLVDEATEAAQWEFVAAADRNAAQLATLAAATEENGVDATFFIKGADFNRNDLRNAAWQATKSGGNQTIGGPNGDRQTYGCESWNNTFDVDQTIENLPEGVYEFSIAGYGTNGTTYIYANETEAPFVNTTGAANFGAALDAIANGEFTGNTTGKVTVISGTLKIGVKRTEQVGQDWAVFDNARLTYYGPVPANEYKTAYENALAAAREALADEAYAAVTGDEKTALEQAIATYTTVEDTKDAYVTAATALSEATSAFKAAKTAYEELNNAEASMANVLFPYASAEKKTAAETATTAVATSAADATAKTAALLKAYRQYAESSALLEGVEGATNFTEYIVNPKADEAIAEPWVVVKGEGSGGSLGTLSNEPWTDGEDNSTHSYFDGGNWGGTSWDVALQQEITLPKGKYYLTVKSRAAADLSSFVVFAGETKTEMAHIGASNGLFNRGWNDASVEFELDKDSTIAIGVQGVTSSQYQWMSFSDFRLMQFPSETPGPQPEERNWIVFTEPAAAGELAPQYTNEAGDFILNYVDENEPKKITIDANNAFFGDAETQDKFTHRLKVGGKSGSKNNLTLTVPAAGMLKVYVRSASGSATDRNVVFTQDDKELYNNIVKDEDAIEVDLGGENPTKVYPVISFTVAKGQVAITYPIGALNFYGFELIETADGIQNVKAVENQGVCYDLQGRRVAKPVHGLYILNGKKVFVK